ncbi:MAG: glucokinase [Acidobacteriota bacterium]
MILAADVGGSKTFVGLFERARPRPHLLAVHTMRTLDFPGLPELLRAAVATLDARVEVVSLGVAGPILDGVATMTNVPWRVRGPEIATTLRIPDVRLLNDLEAMAHAVTVLNGDELHTLRAGRPSPTGNAALIAAGTGLGEAILHRVDGRMRPVPTEAGHADFAARTDEEVALLVELRRRFGRVDIERVLSGPGMIHIARHTHHSDHCTVAGDLGAAGAAARVSEAGMPGDAPACKCCAAAVRMFVNAYGAEAGNLALRSVATAGIYLGGGIAPKMLPALVSGGFLAAFGDKAPMAHLLADVPVHVILNQQAGLVGAAVAALEPR